MNTKLSTGTISGRLLILCMLVLPLTFSGCKKNDDNGTAVTAEEAGTIMATAVDPETGGLVLQTEFGANVALNTNSSAFCGITKDSTVAGQFTGTNRSFDFSLSWSRLLTCSGTVPSKYEYTFTGTASYSVPQISSTGNIAGAFSVTGLESSSTQLSFDQTYTYTGTQQSHVRMERTLTSNVTIQSIGLKVDKATRQIVSGTAEIRVTGAASTGETFNYTGTLNFLGGRKATLAVSGGAAFNIQW